MDSGIIACVYCLGEGYDIPLLDGVVFAENMTSNIRIVQSALRKQKRCCASAQDCKDHCADSRPRELDAGRQQLRHEENQRDCCAAWQRGRKYHYKDPGLQDASERIRAPKFVGQKGNGNGRQEQAIECQKKLLRPPGTMGAAREIMRARISRPAGTAVATAEKETNGTVMTIMIDVVLTRICATCG